MNLKNWRLMGGCLTAAGTLACSQSGGGAPGQLGVGSFDYVCVLPSDPVCAQSGQVDTFLFERDLEVDGKDRRRVPGQVAVGARFGLVYAGILPDAEVTITTKAAANADSAGVEVFTIDQPANTSFYASSSAEKIADFIYLEAAEARELLVWNNQESVEKLSLASGEELSLSLTPASKTGSLLGGALQSTWSVADPTIVELSEYSEEAEMPQDQVKNEVDVVLHARAPGTSMITVTALGLTQRVQIEVTP